MRMPFAEVFTFSRAIFEKMWTSYFSHLRRAPCCTAAEDARSAIRKLSIIYLVMKKTNEAKNIVVGIYTLFHKAIEITNSNISNTTRKKLLRYLERGNQM